MELLFKYNYTTFRKIWTLAQLTKFDIYNCLHCCVVVLVNRMYSVFSFRLAAVLKAHYTVLWRSPCPRTKLYHPHSTVLFTIRTYKVNIVIFQPPLNPTQTQIYYDGNVKSRRVMEKLGFVYHHTTTGLEIRLLGETRTGHAMLLTVSDWENKVIKQYGSFSKQR